MRLQPLGHLSGENQLAGTTLTKTFHSAAYPGDAAARVFFNSMGEAVEIATEEEDYRKRVGF